MPRIPLSEAQPGQRLSRPVASPSGVVMVQPGTELTAALIDRLRGLGVDGVTVCADATGEPDGPTVEERLRELDARFAGHE